MSTIGKRIAAARERRAVTQAQLAGALGKDPSAISRAEKGERKVSSFELGQIAEILGTDVRELLGIKRTAPALALAARVAESVSAATSESAVATVTALLEVEGMLDQLGVGSDIPPPLTIIPPTAADAVEAGEIAASTVRKELGETEDALPADLPYWVESNFNVDVIRMSLPEGMSGLCVRSDDRSLAVIRREDFALRQRFTLAHELAHHVFQDGDTLIEESSENLSFSSSDPVERRANSFAASLLVPRSLAMRRCSPGVDETCVLDLMFEAGMSWPAVVYRLHNLGLLDAQVRDRLNEVKASSCATRHGRSAEWRDLSKLSEFGTPRPPQRIASRAIAAYEKGLIGIGPVAEAMMRTDRQDLRQDLAEQGIQP